MRSDHGHPFAEIVAECGNGQRVGVRQGDRHEWRHLAEHPPSVRRLGLV